jgi:hypothetical protein
MERFWNKINVRAEDKCWEWTAATRSGYGAIKIDGSVVSAHRLSWRFEHGEIPDDLYVCHHCDNRLCCNPKHLFLGTHSDNMKDAYEKERLTQLENCEERLEVKSGEANPKSKLTKKEVKRIKFLLDKKDLTHKQIGKKFNVSRQCITDINVGNKWSHI